MVRFALHIQATATEEANRLALGIAEGGFCESKLTLI